jgi:hypothetical protein
MEKKTWQKPKLTVLVRSRPEEAVLTVCKTDHGGGSGRISQGCHEKISDIRCNTDSAS